MLPGDVPERGGELRSLDHHRGAPGQRRPVCGADRARAAAAAGRCGQAQRHRAAARGLDVVSQRSFCPCTTRRAHRTVPPVAESASSWSARKLTFGAWLNASSSGNVIRPGASENQAVSAHSTRDERLAVTCTAGLSPISAVVRPCWERPQDELPAQTIASRLGGCAAERFFAPYRWVRVVRFRPKASISCFFAPLMGRNCNLSIVLPHGSFCGAGS